MKIQRTLPLNMPASTISSRVSSSKSDDRNTLIDKDGSYAIQRWLDDTEGDRVAGRLIMPDGNPKHDSATAIIQERQSSLQGLGRNEKSRKDMRRIHLAGVGAWCHSDHMKAVPHATKDSTCGYEYSSMPEVDLRSLLGEQEYISKRFQGVAGGLEKRK